MKHDCENLQLWNYNNSINIVSFTKKSSESCVEISIKKTVSQDK